MNSTRSRISLNDDDGTTDYKQNWMNLRKQLEHDTRKRVLHLEAMDRRVKQVSDRDDTNVAKLMYRLRRYALEVAYFPQKIGGAILPISISEHSGWGESMTDVERKIITMFSNVIFRLKKFGTTDDVCAEFTEADKDFGMYRYENWLSNRQ